MCHFGRCKFSAEGTVEETEDILRHKKCGGEAVCLALLALAVGCVAEADVTEFMGKRPVYALTRSYSVVVEYQRQAAAFYGEALRAGIQSLAGGFFVFADAVDDRFAAGDGFPDVEQ